MVVALSGGVLGLDLARKYGWAYVDATGAYVASGHRELSAADPIGRQMHRLSMSIADLIDEFHPEWVAVEKPILTGKFTSFDTAVKLMGYAAVASLVAEVREVGFQAVPRSSACKAVVGKGKIAKAEGVLHVRQHYEPLCNSDDQADAILVALTAHKWREAA